MLDILCTRKSQHLRFFCAQCHASPQSARWYSMRMGWGGCVSVSFVSWKRVCRLCWMSVCTSAIRVPLSSSLSCLVLFWVVVLLSTERFPFRAVLWVCHSPVALFVHTQLLNFLFLFYMVAPGWLVTCMFSSASVYGGYIGKLDLGVKGIHAWIGYSRSQTNYDCRKMLKTRSFLRSAFPGCWKLKRKLVGFMEPFNLGFDKEATENKWCTWLTWDPGCQDPKHILWIQS